jgi:hypothetical protein
MLALFVATDNALRPFAVFSHKMQWRISCLFAAPGSKTNYRTTFSFVIIWLFVIAPAVGYIVVRIVEK